MKAIYIKILVFIFLCFNTDSSIAQMQMDWVKRYHGTYDGSDGGRAITVDDSGNVYVTGYSQVGPISFECVTFKYNRFGDTLWTKHYQRSINTQGTDIKVDDSGNVFVSGGSILKYNKRGELIWEKYDSTAYYKMIIDSSGNIYLGGTSLNQLTVGKYNKNGNRIWKKKYSFPGSDGTDRFGDIVKDNNDNIIITGQSKAITTFYDYATIKYSSEGDLIWAKRYNGPSSYSDDGAYGVTADISDNVYVTGYSMDISNNDNCLTIKYDSSGNIIWTKRILSSENIANIGYNLLTDSSYNLFIAGRLNGRTSLIKLDVNSNIIWYRVYSEGSVLTSNYPVLILDSVYNVYVTATSYPTGFADYAAIKYDSSGNQIFIIKYNYLNIGADYVIDMAIDKGGIVYLTGESQAGGGYAYATVKFSPISSNIINNNTLPSGYKLEQNYPNPFNPKTIINYQLSIFNFVSLKVYDILGNEVTSLVNQKQNAGNYSVEFDGSNFSSGIYFYRLEIDGDIIDTKRMVLLK